jgi:hypothetical protein
MRNRRMEALFERRYVVGVRLLLWSWSPVNKQAAVAVRRATHAHAPPRRALSQQRSSFPGDHGVCGAAHFARAR